MSRSTRLYSTDAIALSLNKSNPPQLVVTAYGKAASTGWNDITLVPLEDEVSPDRILDLALVGTPPTGISLPMLVPVVAHFVWEDAEGVLGVTIHARTNTRTELLFRDERRGPFTTLAVGEECTPSPTQIAGEHGAVADADGGGGFPQSFGRQASHITNPVIDNPRPPTTLRYGEEGHFSTLPLGEEGPTTHRLGEEGGTPPTHWFVEDFSIPQVEDPTTTIGAEHGPFEWLDWRRWATQPSRADLGRADLGDNPFGYY